MVGAATGAAQTKAKEVVTGKKASAAEYIVNTAAGGLAGIAAGSGAQHINQAPRQNNPLSESAQFCFI